MHILTNWRRERRIHRTLVALSHQRVVSIHQPGDTWVMERAVTEHDPGVAEALRTCHLRGWVEMVSDAIPQVQWSPGPVEANPIMRAPIYRLTEAGWAQIRRTHAWVIATLLVALVTLIATIVMPWLRQSDSAPGTRLGRDTEPSLEQTRAWIAEAIPQLSWSRQAWTGRASLDSTCTLRLERASVGRVEGRLVRHVTRIPLREVDGKGVYATKQAPGSASENEDAVTVPVSGGRPLIEDSTFWFDGAKGSTDVNRAAEYGIAARDEHAAARIATALRRAVLLCGGKVAAY